MPQADRSHTTALSVSRAPPGTPSAHYVEYAAKLATANAAAGALMGEIRDAARYLKMYHSYSLKSFEDCTRLHRNSLLRMMDPTWMPKPATLRKLDKLVVRAEEKQRGEIFPGETVKRGRPRKMTRRNR
jgi:hypothetical protein